MVDYPKHFAAVFFTSGCGFTCGFCHNAALMGKRQEGLSRETLAEAAAQFKRNWINSVVITGGEPTCSPDLLELIHFFRDRFGFSVKLDTNGSNPLRLAECLPFIDYVAMDVKCGLAAYPEVVGFSEAGKIQQSIALIRAEAKDYEFRTTIIETLHTDEEMDQVRQLIEGSKRYVLQAFIPRDGLPEKKYRSRPRTSSARLHEIKTLMAGCAKEILIRGE